MEVAVRLYVHTSNTQVPDHYLYGIRYTTICIVRCISYEHNITLERVFVWRGKNESERKTDLEKRGEEVIERLT